MIREAIEYIVSLAEPKTQEFDGYHYTDKPLYRIDYNPKAKSMEMSTLSSLIEYIKSGADAMDTKMIVHVKSPTEVLLYSPLDYERSRECLAEVRAQVPGFRFGEFIEQEAFCIGVQSKFINDLDKELMLHISGTVEAGTVAQYGDDGITQKATIKTGITSKADAIVPNHVFLKPYRTFVEVDQPASDFIFRMRQNRNNGVDCALFEADGGAWKIDAMRSIQAYLQDNLKDMEGFIVIS